jgi:hypothetical protein
MTRTACALGMVGALVLAGNLYVVTARAEPAPPAGSAGGDASPERILGMSDLSAEIVHLLQDTRDTYGEDALILQLQLLRNAIHADSILAAGIRVDGVQSHADRRYLAYTVETGIVFHTTRVQQQKRIEHVWNRVVLPSLAPLRACDVPADGVAIELSYFHRPYADAAELDSTVQEDNGQGERVAFYLLREDILAFNDKKLPAARLYERAHPVVDGTLFGTAPREKP